MEVTLDIYLEGYKGSLILSYTYINPFTANKLCPENIVCLLCPIWVHTVCCILSGVCTVCLHINGLQRNTNLI